MPKTFSIAFDGLKKIDRKLTSVRRAADMKILKKALRNSTKMVADDYRNRLIAGGHVETGALTKSIAVRVARYKKGSGKIGMRVIVNTAKLEKIRGAVGFFYPAAVEYGFTDRGGSYHAGDAAMRGSLYGNRAAIEAAVISDLRALIKTMGAR